MILSINLVFNHHEQVRTKRLCHTVKARKKKVEIKENK